jgi:signal transduction histidine kinase
MNPVSTTETQYYTGSKLDIQSVIKASQTLAGEIVLSRLLEKMMHIVIENAGAEKGCLLLPQDLQWFIEAEVNQAEVTVSQSVPLDDSQTVSKAIIRYASRTFKTIVLENARRDNQFSHDPYISTYQPLSILCVPLINQGRLMAIVYLENNLTEGAFTSERVEIINLLSSQMAISIENAQFYNDLEQKIAKRTQELSDALEHLKATQTQLVESEKMASLGGLVAGVAHEINTPLGIGITSASTLAEKTENTANLYDKKQLKGSALKAYFDTALRSSSLILNNLERAGELVQNFKQVAVDQTHLEKRTFFVKKYLEDSLVNLNPYLKKTPHQITVTGDDKIEITSYPGAFSQIITNLVINSLNHAYPNGEAGHLHFELGLESEQLILEYSDDGCGIPSENLDKIFEPFFTTQRAKGGTGLGLHIVYNLMTQKLQGTIRCESEEGKGTKFILNLPKYQS